MSNESSRRAKRAFLTAALLGMAISHAPSCTSDTSGDSSTGGKQADNGGHQGGGGGQSGAQAGDSSSTGGHVGTGGQSAQAGSNSATGGHAGNSAADAQGGASGEHEGADGSAPYTVAMLQSSKANASEITQEEVADLVKNAVAQAGGLDFIHDGQTVVLKPNIVTPYSDFMGTTPLDPTVNGVTTDWRVTKAVADLVRAKNPSGKILVMEGSIAPATKAFPAVGYTKENFGSVVDEFLGFEGDSCHDLSDSLVVSKTGANGKSFWLNKRYANADVVISLPTMKTHSGAGITGAVKNLGVGATPAGRYSAVPDAPNSDCTRGQTADFIDHSTPEALGQFIHDYYSLRPADFVVMDGLQGLQNGPSSIWSGTNYATDKMNMRLILAGKNAVAVDTIEALVMKCDPTKVPHLTKLEADGLGTTDISKIKVVGKQVSEVAKAFAGKQTAICPGPV